ncbi:MAG TPA: cytochrome c [Ohtaekwangia sp.]|nr:cytochrome c [Ohtaekwangia sp.]
MNSRIVRFVLTTLVVFACLYIQRCTPGTDNKSSTKLKQYYVKGEALYITYCSNCHQKDGSGLGLLYPPLNKSDYMSSRRQDVICLIKYGLQGEIIVNGKGYNKPMPPLPRLTDLEIAEIATYIYNTWSHQEGLIDVKEVSGTLSQCKDLQ